MKLADNNSGFFLEVLESIFKIVGEGEKVIACKIEEGVVIEAGKVNT